jgi:hypothetical protein
MKKTVLAVVLSCPINLLMCLQAEAETPGVDTYKRQFDTPTNFHGMVVTGLVECYRTNNSITFYQIKTNTVMWSQLLPAWTGIHFKADGNPDWCFLSRDWEIKGHLFNKGMNWMTSFYPNGQLEGGGLVNVEVIDGIPCESASDGFWGKHPRTHFYEDGKLKSAQVAVTFRHRGQVIKKGKRVNLKPDGSIESIK